MDGSGVRNVSPRRDTLTAIQRSFAGREELIERAFRDNWAFRELCEHYRQCLATLRHWEHEGSPEAVLRHQEYTDLLEDLGREIEGWLDAMEAARLRSSMRLTGR
jgi:hypothetical protein